MPTASWQAAQSTGFSFSLCGKSDVFARSAWQSTQETPAWPCTDAANFFSATKTLRPSARLASASPWQAWQSSFVGPGAGVAGEKAAAKRDRGGEQDARGNETVAGTGGEGNPAPGPAVRGRSAPGPVEHYFFSAG